jgi:ABC-2 type transport system permease protein
MHEARIAYFSMEIALRSEIPTYSGGLGVLAGDTMRSAADLDLPMVGVTLVSRAGYFRQDIVDAHELILAKAVPPFAIGMLALAPGLPVAKGFGVPLSGGVALFVLASALALAAFLAIGFFIGTLAQALQQALLLTFFVLFPLMFLSGTIVPLESTPFAMRALSYSSPVRYYMEVALGILLKRVGLKVLWRQFIALAATAVLLGAWSIARLKRYLYA